MYRTTARDRPALRYSMQRRYPSRLETAYEAAPKGSGDHDLFAEIHVLNRVQQLHPIVHRSLERLAS